MLKKLLEALEKSIRTWDELFTFVGGQLEMDKITWYLIKWDFDSTDTAYIKEWSHPLTSLDANGIKYPSKQLQYHESAIYLGVAPQVNRSQDGQYCELLENAELSTRNICNTHLLHYYSHVYNNYFKFPKITYSFATTSLTNKYFNKIHAVLYPTVIASKGFNRHWPK